MVACLCGCLGCCLLGLVCCFRLPFCFDVLPVNSVGCFVGVVFVSVCCGFNSLLIVAVLFGVLGGVCVMSGGRCLVFVWVLLI